MKLSIPKGTRDFNSEYIIKRRYIINILQSQFEQFGFSPIETPSFENLSTLNGKYGEEGDYLIFKILNSGNFLKNIQINSSIYQISNSKNIIDKISKKALRYDLTIPFARFVAMNRSKLTFPFKRYQIQPVWRADRPQKGRFREFYQCDVDVVGSSSLYIELDLILLCDSIFSKLDLPVIIHLNSRKILLGIAEVAKISKEQVLDFIITLDKISKIGMEGVINEMIIKGISKKSIELIQPIFNLENNYEKRLYSIKKLLLNSKIGEKGIKEIEFLYNSLKSVHLEKSSIRLNYTLARGLNYYTGIIFEVEVNNIKIGSVGGGGRYDNLMELFNLKKISGVGISFGLDRIYLAMQELNLFSNFFSPRNDFLFLNYGHNESLIAFKIIQKLRKYGKKCELYPHKTKFYKQFKYAEKKNYENVVFLGEREINNNEINIKNLTSGEVKTYKWSSQEFEIIF